MHAHRIYGRRSVTIIGVLMVAALLPYVCRGSMLAPDHLTGRTARHGVVSHATDTSTASVIATPEQADRCAAYNSCCLTPAKQKSRYRPETLALCGQIAIVPTAPVPASVAVPHTTPADVPVFPPGTSTPLIC